MVRLNSHLWTVPTSQGAPREGAALLQGLVWCQQCGARMRVRYSIRAAYYECDSPHVKDTLWSNVQFWLFCADDPAETTR